jgi:L-rhamnose-H+ transport protein
MAIPILGIFFHAVGGLGSASFYVPLRRVRGWAWESYWLAQGLIAWVLAPVLAAWIMVPDLLDVFANSPIKNIVLSYIFGVLWGIGALTFGLTMRYLGLSLGNAIALGFCTTFGTLIPPIHDGKFQELISTLSGWVILSGIGVCLGGIALCGWAGVRKENELTEQQRKAGVQEYALGKGIVVAVIAGVMSACFAYGIAAGEPIAEQALKAGAHVLSQNSPIFIFICLGGFTTNLIYCLFLNLRNRSLRDYVTGSSSRLSANYGWVTLAGLLWYSQFLFYGMGETQMGQFGFTSFSLHMAFIIVFANLWGILCKEWTGASRKTWSLVWGGIGVLIISTCIISYGNHLGSMP